MCVCFCLFWHSFLFHPILWRKERESGKLCVWVSECVCMHERKRQPQIRWATNGWWIIPCLSLSTGVITEPAIALGWQWWQPPERFNSDKWYFLIIHLPGPLFCPPVPKPPPCTQNHFFFLSLYLYLFKWAKCASMYVYVCVSVCLSLFVEGSSLFGTRAWGALDQLGRSSWA